MVNNIVRNNGGYGIFYEISSKGIIANNLVYDNNFAGIAVFAASTKVFNNTIINKAGSNVQAFWIMDDDRPAPDKGETWPYTVDAMKTAHASLGVGYAVRVGPNTNAVEFANNLVVGQPVSGGARLNNFGNNRKPTAPNTTSKDYFNRIDYNAYYHISGQTLYSFGATDNIKTSQDFRTVSQRPDFDVNAIQVTGSTTPDPFVDRGQRDFRLKTTSEAFTKKGMPLPADVANAIGVPAGVILSRGFQFVTSSTPTPPPTDTTPPSGPASLAANPASTSQINLSWPFAVDAESGIKEYTVFRNNSLIKTVPATTVTYTDTGLAAGSTYNYQVKAVSNSGLISSGSPVVSARTNSQTSSSADTQAPSIPAGLTRQLVANWGKVRYDLRLTWQPSTDNVGVKEYVVSRNGTILGVTASTSFTDGSLKAGTFYTYSVVAKDAALNTSEPAVTGAKANCVLFACTLE
jgi:parallel beta-helix repeat protein